MTKSADDIAWQERYCIRQKHVERVFIFPLEGTSYCLVKGEDHTSWKGGFFETPEKAIDDEVERVEMTLRSARRDIDWWSGVRLNVASGNYKFKARK